MTAPSALAVVVDTMVVSSIMYGVHDPDRAESYRSLIAGRPILISFATVTEMRYGALKANRGEFRRRGLDRDLAQLTIVKPDDDLMRARAELRARCEKAGHGLGQNHEADRWIAATAIVLGTELVSDDAVVQEAPALLVLSRPN